MAAAAAPRLALYSWVLFLLLSASPLAAQEDSPRFELFVQGGGSFLSNGDPELRVVPISPSFVPPFPPILLAERGADFKATGRLFVGFRYYFNSKNALEASYSYSPNDVRSTSRVFPLPPPLPPTFQFSLKEELNINTVAFNYVRYLTTGKRLEPFITGGLGFTVFDGIHNETKFSGNFGGGVDVWLHRRVRLRAEFRDFLSGRPDIARPPGGTTHNLAPSVGLAFKF